MNTRSVTVALGTLGLGLLLAWPALLRADEQAAATPEGVEVLTRGPIHEAYAGPVDSRPPPMPIVTKQPPDPIDEVPSEMKPEGENVIWIPGYFAWDDDSSDFIWVSGFWRVPPPSREWVPGHWDQVDSGWQWTPGFWADAQQTDVSYLPPPPPSIDAGPSTPAPSADMIYAPGTWVYQDTRYLWRPGFWLTPRPGWVWVPAHFVWTPVGYVFVDGYWDYPLADRGLLFCPVAIDWQVARRGWFYRPHYAVYSDFLLGALFARRGWGSYYFGDYFDPAYDRLGFTPWMNVRIGRAAFDPLFAYYNWSFRDNPAWARDLRGLYAARFSGDVPRPPHTLVQQNTLIQNITNQTIVNKNTVIKNVTVTAPVTSFQSTTVRLARVSQPQLQQFRQVAQTYRQASQHRGQVESRLLSEGPAPTRATDRPRVAKVELPKVAATVAKPARTPPPPPAAPKHEARPIPRHEPPPPAQVHKPLRPEERPQPRTGERPQPRTGERPQPRTGERPAPKPPERPAPKPPERPAPKPPERPAPKPPERPAPKPPEVKPPPAAPKPPPEKPAPKPSEPPPKKDKGK